MLCFSLQKPKRTREIFDLRIENEQKRQQEKAKKKVYLSTAHIFFSYETTKTNDQQSGCAKDLNIVKVGYL